MASPLMENYLEERASKSVLDKVPDVFRRRVIGSTSNRAERGLYSIIFGFP